MNQDILNRNIVSGPTAWMLKGLGYKGWVSGYYHEGNVWEATDGEDALEYTDYEYECIGSRSGFVNENSIYRAAAPTLVEALQFLLDKGFPISVETVYDVASTTVKVLVTYEEALAFKASTLDEALDSALEYITKRSA